MAFIWKEAKTGTWYLDYTPPGGKRSRKRVGKSKQAAQLALRQIEYQLSFDRAGVSTPDMFAGRLLQALRRDHAPKLRTRSCSATGRSSTPQGISRAVVAKAELQQLGRNNLSSISPGAAPARAFARSVTVARMREAWWSSPRRSIPNWTCWPRCSTRRSNGAI